MAVVFDATTPAANGDQTANAVNGITGFTTTGGLVTVGSGANRVLVLSVSLSLDTATSVAAVWDTGGTNQAMTQIVTRGQAGGGCAVLFGLVAPTSGNKNAKITWNNANSDICVNGTSWTGADQTGGATTFPNSTSAVATSSSAISLAVTSAVGNATQVCTATGGTPSAATKTTTYLDSSPASESGAGSRADGAASVTHGWTVTFSSWVAAGTDILADAGVVVGNLAWVTA